MQKLYKIPLLYDLAFRRPLVGHHVDGLIECHRRFRKNHQLERVLELAAGPGRHSLEFAGRNYKSAVLDSAADMCRYASDLAKRNSVSLDVFQANMRDFAIPHKFDLAMILLNSIGHMYTDDDLSRHLSAVWRHLNESGLYVIEAHYPPWTDRTSLHAASWIVEMQGLQMRVDFGSADDEFDQDRHIRKVFVHIVGELRGEPINFQDYLTVRSWSGEALEEVIRESEAFEIVCKLGALNPDTEFDEHESQRLVYVLRRLD
jgi:SAM-dependent methyltransferase